MLCLKASALFFVVADLCNAAVLAWDSFFAMYTYRILCILWVRGHSVRWSRCTNTALSGFSLIVGQTPMKLVEFWTSTEGADIHVRLASKVLHNL